MSTHIKVLITLAVLLAILLGTLAGSWYLYRHTHVKVDGIIYEKNVSQLDLRGRTTSLDHYLNLKKAIPNCRISWDVPFQGSAVPDDTTELTVSSLSEEDVKLLQYFPELKKVDATDCSDYEAISLLQKTYPDCQVDYSVRMDGQVLPKDASRLEFAAGRGNYQELMDLLPYLPEVKTITFDEPELKPQQLISLRETYPDIEITWQKTLFGEKRPDDTEELDISGTKFQSVEEIEEQAAYLTGLKKLVMCDTGLENEDIAGFRERAREHYKVIWNVKIGQFNVRTDETWFMPTKFHKEVKNKDMYNMRYCEDMLCIDLGHNVILDAEWLVGTPHLKYLIIADGPLKDVTPIGNLKELKFVELFMTDIRDITPLLGCTALEDLNLARIPADVKPIAQMTWLKNLWISGGWVPGSTVDYLRKNMPNTHIDASHHHNCCGRGWRQLQNYIDMRELLGMPLLP